MNRKGLGILTAAMLMSICVGCSKPPEGQIALQGTWHGVSGTGSDGVVLEFSGTRYTYTDAAADYRASGVFTAYPNSQPKMMVQKMIEASSDPAISTTNPWVSYSIYEIIDGELTLGYGEVQGDSQGLPADFVGAYAMEKFRRTDLDIDNTGDSAPPTVPE